MGFLHIYCGDGKGKTTAALGLAVRAAGAGMRVHIIQLLKGSDTAELSVLRSIPGITLERCERDFGFVWHMSEQDKLDITACHNDMLEKGYSLARSGGIDMLIIDEFNAAYRCGLLDRTSAERFLNGAPGIESRNAKATRSSSTSRVRASLSMSWLPEGMQIRPFPSVLAQFAL